MFAPISVILSAFFLASALPNGIELVEVPPQGESVEIVAGYASGGLTGFNSIPAVRSLALAAYSAGGKLEFFEEFERTGLRIAVPAWAATMIADQIAPIFEEVPDDHQPSPTDNNDFRAKVEEEIRSAILEFRYPAGEYSTGRAFVLYPGPVPESLRASLSAIPNRPSRPQAETTASKRLPAERTLRFKSDLPVGGVIFAAPAPGVFYEEWYSILFLDRVIRRAVPIKATTELQLTTGPYYYRLELPVPAGQFPEPVEENLLQELQRLQFTRVESRDLEAARQDARSYLESKGVKDWFLSLGIPERREEGLSWIESLTVDDVRVAARDLLVANRVVATWSPRPRRAAVEVESLTAGAGAVVSSPAATRPPLGNADADTLPLPTFRPHTDPPQPSNLPERLASGVSLVASNINGVFVSGESLTRLESEPDAETLKTFQTYRPDRILVLTLPHSMDRMRQLWSSFKGNNNANTGVPKGNVSPGDLPALFLLKTLVDRKLIGAGWWRDAELSISASEGSTLAIRADAEERRRIIEWIKSFASERPSDAELAWAREVAVHRFGTVQADLQALIWERDSQGTIQDLQTVGAGHVQDIARIYF